MYMLRSMYSGISGMKNFQTKLDVIGNNVANVNTAGFKKGRVLFKDMISQQVGSANAPTNQNGVNLGGINAKQIGLGSQIQSIDTLHTEGSTQSTGRTLDLSIAGDGYFRVQSGNGEEFYTRAGNFYVDANGALVNGDGYKVLNTNNQAITIGTNAEDIAIDTSGRINVKVNGNWNVVATLGLTRFSNPEGLEKAGGSLFQSSANSGAPLIGTPGGDGYGEVMSGTLEMSNVDLSEEFTDMIVAQRGFQANTKVITTSDEVLQELLNLKR